MRMLRTLVGAVVALAVCFGATGRGPAARAQSNVQFIFVSVLDRGVPVINLTADDFIVEEAGTMIRTGAPCCLGSGSP